MVPHSKKETLGCRSSDRKQSKTKHEMQHLFDKKWIHKKQLTVQNPLKVFKMLTITVYTKCLATNKVSFLEKVQYKA